MCELYVNISQQKPITEKTYLYGPYQLQTEHAFIPSVNYEKLTNGFKHMCNPKVVFSHKRFFSDGSMSTEEW